MKLTAAQRNCLARFAKGMPMAPPAIASCIKAGLLRRSKAGLHMTPAGTAAWAGQRATEPLTASLVHITACFSAIAERDLSALTADQQADLATWLHATEEALSALEAEITK